MTDEAFTRILSDALIQCHRQRASTGAYYGKIGVYGMGAGVVVWSLKFALRDTRFDCYADSLECLGVGIAGWAAAFGIVGLCEF